MGPKTIKLLKVLNEIIGLLESENEDHWAGLLKKYKSRIQNSDFSGIELLLNAYGGMGSFSDLVIVQNNDKLNQLRSEAFDLVQDIKREQ